MHGGREICSPGKFFGHIGSKITYLINWSKTIGQSE